MVKDKNYGYAIRQIRNFLDAPDLDTKNIKDEATQNAIIAIQNQIKMIVSVLEGEIPDDQKF